MESGVYVGEAILRFWADHVSPVLAGECPLVSRKWVALVARSIDTRKKNKEEHCWSVAFSS